jgi:hypothetical protein
MILVSLLLACSGCQSFVASVSGTFVGNIASDKVIKEMNKNDNEQKIPKKAL